jgi:hypothetical protein
VIMLKLTRYARSAASQDLQWQPKKDFMRDDPCGQKLL